MEEQQNKKDKKKFLIVSLCSNLGILFAFKYFNFFSDSFASLYSYLNIFADAPHLNFLLPVGISFYTFQTLSYSIDVYKGEKKAERHLGIFALYVSFFPQLVAGPIERSVKLLPQFFEKHNPDYVRITSGLKLMLFGFFKKMVIADYLAVLVNEVYNHPSHYNGLIIVLATYFFAFQIYCDFSGYSDIAIGAARVLGIDLMLNFRRPYFSKSITEFWSRWHMSLSTWFRDYVYIPLGGSKVAKSRWAFNILATFLLSGLWHGASWGFVLWGLLHSLYYLLGSFTKSFREVIYKKLSLDKLPLLLKFIKIFVTFNLVCFAWIFFRANSIDDAFILVRNLFEPAMDWAGLQNKYSLSLAFASLGTLILIELFQEGFKLSDLLDKKPTLIRWSVYSAAIVVILVFANYNVEEFIYFQF